MSISLSLVNAEKEIKTAGFAALAGEINKRIIRTIPSVVEKVKQAVERSISSQDTIIALSDYYAGGLAAELGLNPGQGPLAASQIVSIITEDTQFRFNKLNNKLKGSIEFYIAHNAIDKLLSLPVGHVLYGKGDLHWLRWLLTRGDDIIVSNYTYNAKTGFGRSGGGSMMLGGSWRVPPKHSGDSENNFISKALFNKEFQTELENIFTRYI